MLRTKSLIGALLLAVGCGGAPGPDLSTRLEADRASPREEGPLRAEHYGGAAPAVDLRSREQDLWSELAGESDGCSCMIDPRLVLAARLHADDLSARDGGPRRGDIDHLRFQLETVGGTDYGVQSFVASPDAEGRAALERFVAKRGGEWTHCGVGAAAGTSDAVVVWIGVRRLLELDPIPVRSRVGARLRVGGGVLVDEPRRLLAYQGLPDGSVRRLAVEGSRRLEVTVELDRGGRHDLEILLDVGRGPEVAALLHLYAGVEPAVRPVVTPDLGAGDGDLALDERLASMLTAARRRSGLRPLRRDPRLDEIACEHCEAMTQLGFFGHVGPRGDDLAARLRSHDLLPQRSAENIARSSSVARAHRNLMASPSHRMHVLDRSFTHVGIGVARDGDEVVVTQVFARW
ncbi:MAG: CAP domain-containing protein [Polyangia bacterium]